MKLFTSRWYFLGLLFVMYVCNIIDRAVITLLVEPIKHDLKLSDAQIGFLTGFAFALFYTIMALPIAILADRFNRTKLIAVCSAVWSVMTAATGAAVGFVSAACSRMGVGLGEAGLTPAANSLIGDLFEPRERGKAIGIYISAVPVGTMAAGYMGGWLEDIIGWRMTFVVFGAAGLVVTAVFCLTFREPVRGALDRMSGAAKHVTLMETIRFLVSLRSCRYFFPAFALFGFVNAGVHNWTPAFFMRSHDMPLMQMAALIGTISGIGGAVGMLGGGLLADHFAKRDVGGYLRVPAMALLVTLPLYFGVYLTSSWAGAALLLVFPIITGAIIVPPALALVQRLVAGNMRAVAIAVFLLVLHVVGMGGGPFVVGAVSDALQPYSGVDSLRYSLLGVLPVNLLVILLLWKGARFVADDLQRVDRDHAKPDAQAHSTTSADRSVDQTSFVARKR